MNHDEPQFENKVEKFSAVKKCPRCGQLSLTFKNNEVYCENCGYNEKIPAVK